MTADGARVLVAGVGNLFLGDDGFGPEVVSRLARRPLADGVQVVDFGIRAIDLAYALGDGYELVILVDAASRGDAPGTLYVIEPDLAAPAGAFTPLAAGHSLVPDQVLALLGSLGDERRPRAIRVVGCEPAFIPQDPELAVGLSGPVAAAVDEAVTLIERLVEGHAAA